MYSTVYVFSVVLLYVNAFGINLMWYKSGDNTQTEMVKAVTAMGDHLADLASLQFDSLLQVVASNGCYLLTQMSLLVHLFQEPHFDIVDFVRS